MWINKIKGSSYLASLSFSSRFFFRGKCDNLRVTLRMFCIPAQLAM